MTEPTQSDWVRQEHAEGCAVATAAMLIGKSYAEVIASFVGCPQPVEPDEWHTKGRTFYHLDWVLAKSGAFMQRRYKAWGWPMEPFAPQHYASVVQPSGHFHFVVMRGDGIVLDPLREGAFSLSDWPDVNYITGLVWSKGDCA